MVKTEEVCRWCLQPRAECRDSSCDSEPTFTAVCVSGRWVSVEESWPTRPETLTPVYHGAGAE